MKKTLSLLLALTAATLAVADVTMEQVLAGKDYPLTLKLKDPDGTWRRFTAATGNEPMNPYRAMYGMAGGGSTHFTKGQTVTVGGETYLVAYRIQTKPFDMVAWQQMAMRGGGQPPEPEKPTDRKSTRLNSSHRT